MNHISRMQVFYSFEQLIHNILFVDVLQYVASFYHIVQVGIYNIVCAQCNLIHNTYFTYRVVQKNEASLHFPKYLENY